ncbi:MAG TPA: beta/gamma crystallin family protein, partial [Caldimonas sp.]|nr:beta/gamma crystallin family protein [Caldimonas sp.]
MLSGTSARRCRSAARGSAAFNQALQPALLPSKRRAMNHTLRPLLGIAALAFAAHASAQITFYEGEGFRGRTFAVNGEVRNFDRSGFNDRASSVVVDRGRWEVCEDARFQGRCVVLRRGSYDSLTNMGLGNRISSVRPVDRNRQYENEPQPVLDTPYEYRRRPSERLSEAPVTSVRAVVGPPEQRCWTERQQVSAEPERRDYNVPGAVIGGVLGGILGHQIGGGSGKKIATVGGAVGGAAIGAHVNSSTSSSQYSTRDVRR